MAAQQTTPEHVIAEMTNAELRELLTDLRIASTPSNAKRLRHLTQLLGDFEAAIETMVGPIAMASSTRRLVRPARAA